MSTQIIGCELDVANSQFFGSYISRTHTYTRVSLLLQIRNDPYRRETLTRMERRLQSGKTVILEHVQESSLSGVIETQEENLCILVKEA